MAAYGGQYSGFPECDEAEGISEAQACIGTAPSLIHLVTRSYRDLIYAVRRHCDTHNEVPLPQALVPIHAFFQSTFPNARIIDYA